MNNKNIPVARFTASMLDNGKYHRLGNTSMEVQCADYEVLCDNLTEEERNNLDKIYLTITGDMELTERYDEGWYLCEVKILNEFNIDVDEFEVVKVLPGLRTRGDHKVTKPSYSSDSYELIIEKKEESYMMPIKYRFEGVPMKDGNSHRIGDPNKVFDAEGYSNYYIVHEESLNEEEKEIVNKKK